MIVVDKNTCSGEPRIKGHRITVVNVLSWLRAGATIEDITEDYGLTEDEVRECLSYAINRIK